ncbi:MAG: DUF3885 domain-containing protein [Sphingomonas sp.]
MTNLPFDEKWAEPYCASPFRLRFELGGESFDTDRSVPRFVRAFGRARTLTNDVFAEAEELVSVIGCWPACHLDIRAPARDGFAALEQAGFRSQPIGEWKGGHPRYSLPDDEDGQRDATGKIFDLRDAPEDRDVIIWCAISCEMVVAPKAPVTSFLIDPARQILVHVYDDRGMDVISLKRDTLVELYRQHNSWLLDYDRERIIEAFGNLE